MTAILDRKPVKRLLYRTFGVRNGEKFGIPDAADRKFWHRLEARGEV